MFVNHYSEPRSLEVAYLSAMTTLIKKTFPTTNDRTGIPTYRSMIPISFSFNLLGYKNQRQLPLMIGRRTPLRGVLAELLWFLSGSRSKHDIVEKLKFPIWESWGKEDTDDMGPVYGHQWRTWGATSEDPKGFDQIKNLINQLKQDPYSRRHVVSTWNPKELNTEWVALPPCHGLTIQFAVLLNNIGEPTLCSRVYMRSTDMPVGGVANMIMYSILTHMISKEINVLPGTVSFFMALPHVYHNQIEAVKEWHESYHESFLSSSNYGFLEFGSKPFSVTDQEWDLNWFKYSPKQSNDKDYIFTLKGYNPKRSIHIPVAV